MPILAILAMLAGAGASLVTLVFLLACGANSSPKQIHELKMMMIGVALLALVGLVGGVWALVKGSHGISISIGLLPVAGCVGLIVWMLITEY